MAQSSKSLSEQMQELDYFTQRQIINEFPSVFPEYHNIKEADYTPIIETSNINFDDMGIVIFFALGIVAMVLTWL